MQFAYDVMQIIPSVHATVTSGPCLVLAHFKAPGVEPYLPGSVIHVDNVASLRQRGAVIHQISSVDPEWHLLVAVEKEPVLFTMTWSEEDRLDSKILGLVDFCHCNVCDCGVSASVHSTSSNSANVPVGFEAQLTASYRALRHNTTGQLKSVLQKTVRFHAETVELPGAGHVCARLYTMVAFLLCLVHPGYLDNSVHRKITGKEAAFKRMAVIAVEDGFATFLSLSAMLGIVALIQHNSKWPVPLKLVEMGLIQLAAMQRSRRVPRWEAFKTHGVPSLPLGPRTYTPGESLVTDVQTARLLLRRVGSLPGDHDMFGYFQQSLAKDVSNPYVYACDIRTSARDMQVRMDRTPMADTTNFFKSSPLSVIDMPALHVIDNHAFPAISHFVATAAPLRSLFGAIFSHVTGFNPLRRVWTESKWNDLTRRAQARVWNLHFSDQSWPLTSAPLLEFTVDPELCFYPEPLHYAHLAAAVGHVQVTVDVIPESDESSDDEGLTKLKLCKTSRRTKKHLIVTLPTEEDGHPSALVKPKRQDGKSKSALSEAQEDDQVFCKCFFHPRALCFNPQFNVIG